MAVPPSSARQRPAPARRRVVPALAFAVLGALIVRVVLGALNFSTAVIRAAPSPPSEADTIPSYLWELHSSRERSPFVRAEGTKLWRFGEPYRFVGANLWQAMHLGADADAGGDRARLVRELDRLQALGVANLRVMAASEGPDESDESVGAGLVDLALSVGSATPWRVLPAMQPSPGLYNDGVVAGLDFLLVELARRDMTAVLVLGNTWPFTGGFAQYVAWATGKEIPYPLSQNCRLVVICCEKLMSLNCQSVRQTV